MSLKNPGLAIALIAITTMGMVFCANPIEEFFQRIHRENVIMYQCYRNGISFEPEDAKNLRILWIGNRYDVNKALCFVTFMEPGKTKETTKMVYAEYLPEVERGLLDGKVILDQLLHPAYGTAYFFKQVDLTDGRTIFKIYDTNPTCRNAKALYNSISAMEYVRGNIKTPQLPEEGFQQGEKGTMSRYFIPALKY